MKIKDWKVEIVENPEKGVKWGVTVEITNSQGKDYALGQSFSNKKDAHNAWVFIRAIMRSLKELP